MGSQVVDLDWVGRVGHRLSVESLACSTSPGSVTAKCVQEARDT